MKWELQEAGWWVHETFGGICWEGDGWYFYDKRKHPDERGLITGPYKTLSEAKKRAEA